MKFYFVHGETVGDDQVVIPAKLKFCSEPGEPVDAKRTKSILESKYALSTRASWPELRLVPLDAGQQDSILKLAEAADVASDVRFVGAGTPTLSCWLRAQGHIAEDTVLVCCSGWGSTTKRRKSEKPNQVQQYQIINNLLDDASDAIAYGKVLSARKISAEAALGELTALEVENETALIGMRLQGGVTGCLAFELESWRIDPSGTAPRDTWDALLDLFVKVSLPQTRAALVGHFVKWPDWSKPFRSLESGIDFPEMLSQIVGGSRSSQFLVNAREFCASSKRLENSAIEFADRVAKVNKPAQHVNFTNPHDLHIWNEFFEALDQAHDLMPYHPDWQSTANLLEQVALGWGADFSRAYRDAMNFPRVIQALKSSTDPKLQELIRAEVADGTRTVTFPDFATAVEDLKQRHMQNQSVLYTEHGIQRDVSIVWTSVDISVTPVWDPLNWSWTGFEVFVAPWPTPNEAERLVCDVKWGEAGWYLEEVSTLARS
ncbi:hypothetical protein ACIQMR_31465 [Streptomyces sp. NPDC091376]|uniref:hypothetical protein n=1 Tax=Streptomyces sp. NPDC091376 TaxID=3365994 RepID=UPI003818F964